MRLSNKLVHELQPLGRNQTFEDDSIPYLLITVYPNGKKLWFFRHQTSIGDTLISLGAFSKVDVSYARKKAKALIKCTDGGGQNNGLLEREKSYIFRVKRQVSLSKMIKQRDDRQFRPNPMFQPKQKLANQGFDVKRAAQEKSAYQNKQRQREEIYAAWERYETSRDISHLLPLLREGYFSQQPMPIGMSETIADLLEKHIPANGGSQLNTEADDNHIFMTYWRHTEFQTGVAPLLLDANALDECAAFMEAIGRGLSLDTIRSRVKGGYQNWRKYNSQKLKNSARILKSLMSVEDNPEEDPGQS